MCKIGVLGEVLEGCFLLEIYVYVKGDSDVDVFKCVYVVMCKMFDVLWFGCDVDLLLVILYDVLIFVFIVEKEIGCVDECKCIVGVFVCWLENYMLL